MSYFHLFREKYITVTEERPAMDTGDIVIAQDAPNPLNDNDFLQLRALVNPDSHADSDDYSIAKYTQAVLFVTQHT